MFVWSKKFETNIESVDIQHKMLFELLSQLAERFKQGDPDETIVENVLKQLFVYAEKHFTEEEELMEQHHLDARHLSLHRMEHKSFIYDVNSMWEHLNMHEEISDKLVGFIMSWLTYHILGMDMAMAAQIRAIQNGMSPAQAHNTYRIARHDVATTRLLLDAVLDLWRESMVRCHKLEEKLRIRPPK
jgi:hemerythrin-like metal-binding protein